MSKKLIIKKVKDKDCCCIKIMAKNHKHILRLCSDLSCFINEDKKNDKPEGIFAYPDPDDITNVKTLIFGPDDTPYEGGIFLFSLKFPKRYPFEPPTAKFETIDNHVRFNPNLYQEGKVCLSILGTWQGPPWQPSQTLSSVMISIQSLLSENPLLNEPGRDNVIDTEEGKQKCQKYNLYLKYHKIRLAIMVILDGRYPEFDCFQQNFEKYFYDKHEKMLKELEEIAKNTPIVKVDSSVDYFVKSEILNFAELYEKFQIFCLKKIPEIKEKYKLN
jgi:ubiquitin-conjugating enzyme E2 Z